MSVHTNQKPHRTKSVRQAINAVTSVVVSISMVLSLYGCGSTETLSLTATALSSRASAAMSAVSFLRQASEAGKENGTPDDKSKHEEKSTSAEQSNDETPKQEWPRKLAETIKVDDNDHFVTFKVEYGEGAGIPYDATLKVENLDANDDRKNELRGLLQVGEGDYEAGSAFAKATLVAGEKEVQPTEPIDVVVETNLIEWSQSDAIEMALLGNADVTTLNVENLTGKDDDGKESEEPPYARVKFSTGALGEFGFAVVANTKATSELDGMLVDVLGGRMADIRISESERDEQVAENEKLVRVITTHVEPAHAWPTKLWVTAHAADQEDGAKSYIVGRYIHQGEIGAELFGRDGTNEPVAITSGDEIALIRVAVPSEPVESPAPEEEPAPEEQAAPGEQSEQEVPAVKAQSAKPEEKSQTDPNPEVEVEGDKPDEVEPQNDENLLRGSKGEDDLVEVTVTANAVSKEYGDEDPELTATVEGLAEGDAIDYTLSRDVGDTPGDYTITPVGEEIQSGYKVIYNTGTFTINKKAVTITANPATKVYDGTELTDDGYTCTALAYDHVLESVTVTGGQTKVGTSENVASNARIVDNAGNDVTQECYEIEYARGTLEVTAKPVTITADSAEKAYDGTALVKDSYTYTDLAEGDEIESVTVTGSQTEVGESSNIPSAVRIRNSSGDNVTNCYQIETVNGTLRVLSGDVTLTAKSAIKVANGEEQSVSGFSSSVEGLEFEGVSAKGSGTEVGTYPVTFSGVTVGTTTDTTGKYSVAGTVDGRLIIVENEPLAKELTSFDGNLATYAITINPEEVELNDGSDLVLKDTFDENQSIIYSTVDVPSGVTYDYSGNTGTFVIPDETSVTITYTTRVKGSAGDEVTFENTARLGIGKGSSFEELCKKTITNTKTITPTGTDIEGTDGIYTIQLYAYPDGDMETGLPGATFRLLDANQRPVTDGNGDEVFFTTGSDGYATVELHDGTVSIRKNTVYYLEMTEAPVTSNPSGGFTYYRIDTNRYSFLITDSPTYGTVDEDGKQVYSYYSGDVLKLRCYPEAAGINVTKRFSGNHELTDGQQKSITFELQKEVAGTFEHVESHAYSEFSNGSMTFSTVPEKASTYRVVEHGDDVTSLGLDGSIAHSSSATVTYYQDGTLVSKNTPEFEVNPDNHAYCFNVVFDNEYVEHKLCITKIDESTGKLVRGATFTARTASGDANFKEYITREDGTITITKEDAYESGVLYYVVETAAPEGYVLSSSPKKTYFYFSESGVDDPAVIPADAIDLTTSYDSVSVPNQEKTTNVPVTVTWGATGKGDWPDEVDHVLVGLYQTVGGETTPVTGSSAQRTVTLTKDAFYDNTSFMNLPVRDESNRDITYSVKVLGIYGNADETNDLTGDYASSSSVSGTGWHIVKNEPGTSVTVHKSWYDLDKNLITNTTVLRQKPDVTFDLYQMKTDNEGDLTREELVEFLGSVEPVRTGIKLTNDASWTATVTSLPKADVDASPYYYFAVENIDELRNNEDAYSIVAATSSSNRMLTIKNTQTPVTVVVQAQDCNKEYGDADPVFVVEAEVQEDGYTASVSGPDSDDKYTVTVTDGSGAERSLQLECERNPGETVGRYSIRLAPVGSTDAFGYRVRFDTATLTIDYADVIVKGSATKVYGDPDPEKLVEIEGLKNDEPESVISYNARRQPGEHVGSHAITVTGESVQGNYRVTFQNGSLDITPASVSVTADNKQKTYGDSDPELTVTIKGLKNDDAPTVITYAISRDEGESVGDYAIKVSGDESQGNYTVTYVPGTFKIAGHQVVVRVNNVYKTYGDEDPTFTATVTGLQGDDTIDYGFSRDEGEDAGTYWIHASGESIQGNYEVTYITGRLTITRANLTVTPDNVLKLYDGADQQPDPDFTLSLDTLVDRDKGDDGLVPTLDKDTNTWTYTRGDGGEPELIFNVTRDEGENPGTYTIKVTGEKEQKNYVVTYRTGVLTILPSYNVVVHQVNRDSVDTHNNPEYTYKATLDTTAIGQEKYTGSGFVDGEMTFTLPDGEANSKTLIIPAEAKLTLAQQSGSDDYSTDVTLNGTAVEGTTVVIPSVESGSSITYTHNRIALPILARAALRQTPDLKADEDGARDMEPLGYAGIPREGGDPTYQVIDAAFVEGLDASFGFVRPDEKYYVYEHASVYHDGGADPTKNVTAIRYHNGKWQYTTGDDYTNDDAYIKFVEGDQLMLFYMPQFICRTGGESFYTLNDALQYITDNGNTTATIEMLIDEYVMSSSDSLTIPDGYNITLTSAEGIDAVIRRKANFTSGHMFTNEGGFTLDAITLDGNGVSTSEAMVLNKKAGSNPVLTVASNATLRDAHGINGGAIYIANGTAEIGGALTGNRATSGGAVYIYGGNVTLSGPLTGNSAQNGGAVFFHGGELTLGSAEVTGNSATNGGALYLDSGNGNHTATLTATGALGGEDTASANTATNGGAVYVAGGKLVVQGEVKNNNATEKGGAVFIANGAVDINSADAHIVQNTAANGGALYLEGGTVTLSAGAVNENTASASGGMMYATNGTVNITGGEVIGNAATEGNGGGIAYAGSGEVTITGGAIQDNRAENGFGGAVYQSSGTVTVKSTIDGANKAKNGSAVYVDETGIANFDGCAIRGNEATEGGAIGMGKASARMYFSGNAIISGNTSDASVAAGRACNVYLNQDTDLVINTGGLGGSANIGVYVPDGNEDENDYNRGDACGKFGTYTESTNLSKFKNDRNTTLVAQANNFKIMWSKQIKVEVFRLTPYTETTFPTGSNGTSICNFTYYPRSQKNAIYDLVMEMYNNVSPGSFKNKLNADKDTYAYSFAASAGSFSKFLTDVDWDSARGWVFKQHDNTSVDNKNLRLYYSEAAYLSIVNNNKQGYTLTIDPLEVLNKDAATTGYGYVTAVNYVTQDTLLPLQDTSNLLNADGKLVLKDGESVKLLFPGAVKKPWSLTGVFTDADGSPVANAAYTYTLDRTHGEPAKTGYTDENGMVSHAATTDGTAGGTYEILFGDPINICKVGDRPFPTLNAAWDYIKDNNLTTSFTYTKSDGTTEEKTVRGGKIEMLLDYLQPLNDVLNIPKGYYIELTTAEAGDGALNYHGGVNAEGEPITRATISRDSDNSGAAIIAEADKASAVLADACTSYITIDNITFDGKALAKKGNGGAVSTINNVVTLRNCDFKGYQAQRGGAVFVMWGGLTVDGCNFSNCTTGDSNDKTGGGAIWSTSEVLTVKNSKFDHCACVEVTGGKSQAGAIFHNIQQKDKPVYNGASGYATYPANYYLGTKTVVENCDFSDCYAEQGSGGTIESDALKIYLTNCNFDGSYSNKNNANGGVLNALHNNLYQGTGVYSALSGSLLEVVGCTFKNCQTQKTGSCGGAIQASNTETVRIWGCDFENCSSANGGAIRMGANDSTLDIQASTFKNCTGRTRAGAIYTPAKTLTIGNTYTLHKGTAAEQTVTRESKFEECTSPFYGAVNQNRDSAGSSATVSNTTFTNCSSTNSEAGAIYTIAKNLIVSDSAFVGCTGTKNGGAVYHAATSDELTNVVFDGCTSGQAGGGAYLISSTVSIRGGSFENCVGQSQGGGLYAKNTVTIDDCDFDTNKVLDSSGTGGAIYFAEGTLSFSNGAIENCEANKGGGVYQANGTVNFNSGSIEECDAAYGGGIYKYNGTLTINEGSIKNCDASESGGGIYNRISGVNYYAPVNAESSIEGCTAKNGGGIYMEQGTLNLGEKDQGTRGAISNCTASEYGGGIYIYGSNASVLRNTSTIENCSAEGAGGGVYLRSGTFTIYGDGQIKDCAAGQADVDEGGTKTYTFTADNKGGGVYQAGGTFNFYAGSNGKIDHCLAYDGGGVYHAGGTYNNGGDTDKSGNITRCDAANQGGGIYQAGGTLNVAGGTIGGSDTSEANTANYGAGVFVADGATANFNNSNVATLSPAITYNHARVGGGGVAVGGDSAKLYFTNKSTVQYNAMGEDNVECNVYLDRNSNVVINNGSLHENAYIGVYVSDEWENYHGLAGMPFATRTSTSTNNLNRYFNDRYPYSGAQGSGSLVIWQPYVCKITDGTHLLYTDSACKKPAVFTKLDNNDGNDKGNAFGYIKSGAALYRKNAETGVPESYSGAYTIEMLVDGYTCDTRIALYGGKTVTLTTASKEKDECGFFYNGEAEFATVKKGGTWTDAWITNRGDLTFKNITMDANGRTSSGTNRGGIVAIKDSGAVTIQANATLKNSNTSSDGGGAIALYNNTSVLNMEGGTIENCTATGKLGGAVYIIANGTFNMSGGTIKDCSAASGGAVYVAVSGKFNMSGGTITGCSATNQGGAITVAGGNARLTFSGIVKVIDNTATKGGSVVRNNVELSQDSNAIINAGTLNSQSEIGVYATDGTPYNGHGKQDLPFGTWQDGTNLYSFVNDRHTDLHGLRNASNASDHLIYWKPSPVLQITKTVVSDLADDSNRNFNFKVTLSDGTFSGYYGDMQFVNGVATFTLNGGDANTKMATGLPESFVNDGVTYTVEEILTPEEQEDFSTSNVHKVLGEDVPGTGESVDGSFGENMRAGEASTGNSYVTFMNTRAKADVTISKNVTKGIEGDSSESFHFILQLDDATITNKSYSVVSKGANGEETTSQIAITDGKGEFTLKDGQSFTVKELPTDLGFTVTEELTQAQKEYFRSYIKVGAEDERFSSFARGVVGKDASIVFRNERYGVVCKIVNDNDDRDQLYYIRDGVPTPAIFETLEEAFALISAGTHLQTKNGSTAETQLRVEMVVPNYEMTGTATLAEGKIVTLSTARTNDDMYPYQGDPGLAATITRGFDGDSMIVDNGILTLDEITLDGGYTTEEGQTSYSSNAKGGIIRVEGTEELVVNSGATLRNSQVKDAPASGDDTDNNAGGAIWLASGATLTMNGTIDNCQTNNGGGIYAAGGSGALTIGGTVQNCQATDGGGIYTGSGRVVMANSESTFTGNTATHDGGAIYANENVVVSGATFGGADNGEGNMAEGAGGAIYLAPNATFTMSDGSFIGNEAANGGALCVQSTTTITGGSFTNNAATINGGAINAIPDAEVTISNATFTGNHASYGGAICNQSNVTFSSGSMKENYASENGGAVYVTDGKTFGMSGGSITGNKSKQGAISTGSNAILNFSGGAVVTGNTNPTGSTAMNVYLGYDDNAVINSTGLGMNANIGVYVKDDDDKAIYYDHGIAARNFGTYAGSAPLTANLNGFKNDCDPTLHGVPGVTVDGGNYIAWVGNALNLVVCDYATKDSDEPTVIPNTSFSLTNTKDTDDESDDVQVWTGTSDNDGKLSVPWGAMETKDGNVASFAANSTYVLRETAANDAYVYPAGSWSVTIGRNNSVAWTTTASEGEKNRTLDIAGPEDATIGAVFTVYNDAEPQVTFNANGDGARLSDGTVERQDSVDFGTNETSHVYTIEEANPMRPGCGFVCWNTVKNPSEQDPGVAYRKGDTYKFFRHSDDDNLTLYAQWSPVVCKITDRDDNLLYVNGGPAVYTTLKDAFADFNEASFTSTATSDDSATQRKIKMLVNSYEMNTAVELARPRTAILTTAEASDTDGYHGPFVPGDPSTVCTITRGKTVAGSMFVDKYNFTLTNITLDGAGLEAEGNGGIVRTEGDYAQLMVGAGATLQHAKVSGNGGAIYAGEDTTVTLSAGSILGNVAANGGALYAMGTVNLTGTTITSNSANSSEGGEGGRGGGIYIATGGTLTMSGGKVGTSGNGNTAAYGAGVYLQGTGSFSGGTISYNTAITDGGGVYTEGQTNLSGVSISNNSAARDGGGVYVGANGLLKMTGGSMGASGKANTALNGAGVYLAEGSGASTFTGGTIAYNSADSEGGGLYTAADATLSGTNVTNNSACNGGGVFVDAASLDLKKGNIRANNAAAVGGNGGLGGGVYVSEGANLTMDGGTIGGTTASYKNSAVNGAGVYLEGSESGHATFTLVSGSLVYNRASGLGAAVYAADYAQMSMSGGSIRLNRASAKDGGAVNVGGNYTKLNFSGDPVIFNNPASAATTAQKNVVLSEDENGVINTDGSGLVGGTIGVYAVDTQTGGSTIYKKHGIYSKPFGTFGANDSTLDSRLNAKYFVNDRNLGLYGVPDYENIDTDNTVYWLNVVCKLTASDDALLYELKSVNGAGTSIYGPAVYETVRDGFGATGNTLYRKSGSAYVEYTGALKLKMLQDYTLRSSDDPRYDEANITYNTAKDLTFTTAETDISTTMSKNGDVFIYVPSEAAEEGSESLTKATLTRNQSTSSMFVVNTTSNFTVNDLIFDGASTSMMTAPSINGGAFNIAGVATATFGGVTIHNMNATGNGGAIYVGSGAVAIGDGTTITNCQANRGGALHVTDEASASITGGTMSGNSSTEGGAVDVGGANAKLYFSGSPVVYDNTDQEGVQKNVVLSVDDNAVINANGALGTDAKIGVYDATTANHRATGELFGSHSNATGLNAFVDDLDADLYGVADPEHEGYICWVYSTIPVTKEWKIIEGYGETPTDVTVQIKRVNEDDQQLDNVDTLTITRTYGWTKTSKRLRPGEIYVLEETMIGNKNIADTVYSATYSTNSVTAVPIDEVTDDNNNNVVVTNTNTLIPIEIKKIWDDGIPEEQRKAVGFEVFGVRGATGESQTKEKISCYIGNWPDSPKVTTIDGERSESTWAELVYAPKFSSTGVAFDAYEISEVEDEANTWRWTAEYEANKPASRDNWHVDNDSDNYQDCYVMLHASNTDVNATNTARYQNVHKMDFYFVDTKNGKLYYTSTDFGAAQKLNRAYLASVQGENNEYFYVKVRLPKNINLGKIQLLANADQSGIHLHTDTSMCTFAYGILTYNELGNKNKPTGAPNFSQHSKNTSVKFDLIEFIDDNPPSNRLIIDGVSQQLSVYTTKRLTLTNSVAGSRRAILRKVAKNTYESLAGGKFKIHRGSATGALVEGKDINGDTTTEFESGDSGVFYVGELNYGTYYIEETQAPDGYMKPSGKYFVVTVNEDGVGYKSEDEAAPLSREVEAT